MSDAIKEMKGILRLITSIAIAWGGLYVFGRYIAKDGENERNKPGMTEVVGTLTRKSYGKTSYTEFRYSYGGKEYTENSHSSSVYDDKTVIGEKYILRVNPDKPTEYTIDNSKPVFTVDEQTDSTAGRLTSVWESEMFGVTSRGATFQYVVDGIAYERDQTISMADTNFSALSEGSCYRVCYWVENPQRAILYGNRQISDCGEE